MSYRQPYPKVSVSTQQGAVLIIVLLFLILIIFAGVIAVRQSTTDLRVATSDQINALLLQSADNANQNIEQSLNGSSSDATYVDMVSRTGPFGHFMLDTSNADHEYVFCFRPRASFFDFNKTTIQTSSGSNILGSGNGYCNPGTAADYISDRNTSMTQVNVSLTPSNAANEAFASYTIGQDSSEISSQAFMFDINSTAVLPAYSGSETTITNCFKKTSQVDLVATPEDAISGCLAGASVPSTVLYEKANVQNLSKGTKCVEFGKGSGKSKEILCNLIDD